MADHEVAPRKAAVAHTGAGPSAESRSPRRRHDDATPSDAAATPRVLPPELQAGLLEAGLAEADHPVFGTPLTGGVSSDVWRADLATGPVCVKRALTQLRVKATWTAPVDRSAYEAAWLAAAGELVPGAACPLVAWAPRNRVLVLAWLDPASSPVWKAELAAGRVDPAVGRVLGKNLVALHTAMADPARFEERFRADDLFAALRLDPYLLVTARRHPRHAALLTDLARRTAATGRTVIHGDVSPKNVLVTAAGPVLLDAECASWGDPAFDLAFCTNHLLLKAVWLPHLATPLRTTFDAFVARYLAGITWEPPAELEARAATLLPALALARVDGASPVEYLNEDHGRPFVRSRTSELLAAAPTTLAAVADAWFGAATARPGASPTPASTATEETSLAR